MRRTLALVATGEVQHFAEVVSHGQHDLKTIDEVGRIVVVGERVTPAQAATRQRFELRDEGQPGCLDPTPE